MVFDDLLQVAETSIPTYAVGYEEVVGVFILYSQNLEDISKYIGELAARRLLTLSLDDDMWNFAGGNRKVRFFLVPRSVDEVTTTIKGYAYLIFKLIQYALNSIL